MMRIGPGRCASHLAGGLDCHADTGARKLFAARSRRRVVAAALPSWLPTGMVRARRHGLPPEWIPAGDALLPRVTTAPRSSGARSQHQHQHRGANP